MGMEEAWGVPHYESQGAPDTTDYPPGTIILATAALARYPAALMSLMQLQKPVGTSLEWAVGVNFAKNLNQAVEHSRGEWIWLTADDHNYASDLLIRLLAHHVDIVAPVCLLRLPPYSPLVMRQALLPGVYEPWPPAEMPTSGLHPVPASGSGGLLISRKVLDTLTPPYFEVGRVRPDELSEDFWFFHKAREAGFQPYVDFDLAIGHITPTAVWPSKNAAGGWEITLDPSCTIPTTAEVTCPLLAAANLPT